MLLELTKRFEIERNKLINRCTVNLIGMANVKLNENYSNLELVMAMDELKKKGYEIKLTREDDIDVLWLYWDNVPMHRYEFSIAVVSDRVSMVATLIM